MQLIMQLLFKIDSILIPVRPTFFLHMKHLFFFGFGSSAALSSLSEVPGWETDGLGWVTTVKARKGKKG